MLAASCTIGEGISWMLRFVNFMKFNDWAKVYHWHCSFKVGGVVQREGGGGEGGKVL